MKRIFGTLAPALLVAFIAGCGGDGAEQPAGQKVSQATQAEYEKKHVQSSDPKDPRKASSGGSSGKAYEDAMKNRQN